jgi:hypothetical protein
MNVVVFTELLKDYICIKNGYESHEIKIMNDDMIFRYMNDDNMDALSINFSDGDYVFRIILERHKIDILKRTYTINQILNN